METFLVIVFMLVFAVAYFYWETKKKENEQLRELKARQEYMDEREQYKKILKQLPKPQIERVHAITGVTHLGLGHPPGEMPDKLLRVSAAAASLKDENVFCKLTSAQRKEIDVLIGDFEKSMSFYVPAARNALNHATDSGLNFGILSTNAADTALYGMMEARARVNNYNKMTRSVNQNIDDYVTELIRGIQRVCSQ